MHVNRNALEHLAPGKRISEELISGDSARYESMAQSKKMTETRSVIQDKKYQSHQGSKPYPP